MKTNAQEQALVDLLTAKGRDKTIAALIAAITPFAINEYRHGGAHEQWALKGSASRPLRAFWAMLAGVEYVTPEQIGAHADAMKKDASLKPLVICDKTHAPAGYKASIVKPLGGRDGEALRRVCALVVATCADKGRDRSQEGAELFALQVADAVHSAFPSPVAKPRDEAKAQADKLARSIRAIQDASVTLDDSAVDALRAVIAAHDALRAASKPASKPADKPTSTPTGADLTTAIADALTAAGIPETV